MAPSTPVTELGVGYNTFLGTAMPSLLTVDIDSGGGPSEFKPTVHICTSTQDLYNALSIDASIVASTLWGSLAAKVSYFSTLKVTSTTVIILVNATNQNTSTVTGPPVFVQSYKDAKSVYDQGGDSYVSSIATGGEFIGTYCFRTASEDSFQSVIAAAEAKFSSFTSEFSAQFSANITSIASSTNTTADFSMLAIGLGNTAVPTSSDQMVNFVLTFNQIDLPAPEVLDFSTTSYSAVNGCPDFTQIDEYRNSYQDPTETGHGLADLELMAKTCQSSTKEVATIYDFYGLRSVEPKLDTSIAALQGILDAIFQWRLAVHENPTKSGISVPVIDRTLLKVPVVNFSIVTGSPPAGSTGGTAGGNPFTDVQDGMILYGIKPTNMSIAVYGGAVSWIQTSFSYTAPWPDQTTYMPQHGVEQANSTTYQIPIGPEDMVTSCGAASNNVTITGIQVTTDHQGTVTCPSGTTSIQTWNQPSNSRFVGWSGRVNLSGRLGGLSPQWVTFYTVSTWNYPLMKQQ